MTYPVHEDCNLIGSVHHAAICQQIGESIWTRLDREPICLSPRLMGLVERLHNNRPRNSADSGA
jgi:hypothetical protein